MAAGLTTHVLDVHAGVPAQGMRIDFSVRESSGYRLIRSVRTDADGRAPQDLLGPAEIARGTYEIVFHVAEYFAGRGVALADPPFLDQVPVRFAIAKSNEHYHVPLLVSPWSYSTYRGS